MEKVMAGYLLLRNNKESGPYSLEQLVEMGLKAYDLVWVSGKSAAWRYPGEVEELKPYAPAVEEQPYDRFFKKPSEQKEVPVKKQEPAPVQQKDSHYTPAKSVFVTLPGGQKKAVEPVQQPVQPAKDPQPSYDAYKQYQPVTEDQKTGQETQEVAQTITITENPVAAEIKYSQPLDDIKERYVKTLLDRKQRIASKAIVLNWAKKAAVVLAIVAVGVVIGFAMKSGDNKNEKLAVNTQPAAAPVTNEPVQEAPTAEILPAETNTQPEAQLLQQEQQTVEAPTTTTIKPVENKRLQENPELKKLVIEKKPATPLFESQSTEPVFDFKNETSPGVALNERTGERSKKVRDYTTDQETFLPLTPKTTEEKAAEKEKPKAIMKNSSLSKQVSVSSNEYTKVAFGGIRNLQLTVTNDSKQTLDKVTVEVDYLKPSEQPLKTETVNFRSVAPGATMTIRVPDTNRGIKVNYRITNIVSSQPGKDVAAEL